MYQVDIEKCDGCKSCMEVCPSEAISLVDAKAVISEDDCADCGACESECPNSAISPL